MELNQIVREPLYPLAHAAHYVNIHPKTLKTWVHGRKYKTERGDQFFKPLIELEPASGGSLSFVNLVEAHVLRSMRKVHLVRMQHIREAIDFVANRLGVERPLATYNFETAGRALFVRQYGELIDLSQKEQMLLSKELDFHLTRIERSVDKLAQKLYPITRQAYLNSKIIVINPRVSHGRPIIENLGVSTDIIVDRWRAGDPFEVLKRDYGLTHEQYDEALWYEHHQAA